MVGAEKGRRQTRVAPEAPPRACKTTHGRRPLAGARLMLLLHFKGTGPRLAVSLKAAMTLARRLDVGPAGPDLWSVLLRAGPGRRPGSSGTTGYRGGDLAAVKSWPAHQN